MAAPVPADLTIDAFAAARERIRGIAIETPLLTHDAAAGSIRSPSFSSR